MPVPSSNPPQNLRRTPASCRPHAAKPTGVQIPFFEHPQRRGPTPEPQTRSPRCCSEDYRRSSSLLIAADASTRVQQGDWPRCPFLRLFGKTILFHLLAYPARCPAIRRHSSMNFSTSAGSNLKGLLPAPILTAGRYGLRLPEACWMTHEMLTPSLVATSRALTS